MKSISKLVETIELHMGSCRTINSHDAYCHRRSSHRGEASVRGVTQAHPRLVPVHGPVHASWLNQIEIHFSIVQRKTMHRTTSLAWRRSPSDSRTSSATSSSIARPFDWKFTRADLNALIARMRSRYSQSQHVKLAAREIRV